MGADYTALECEEERGCIDDRNISKVSRVSIVFEILICKTTLETSWQTFSTKVIKMALFSSAVHAFFIFIQQQSGAYAPPCSLSSLRNFFKWTHC